MPLTPQQKADAIAGLDAMPRAMRFDGEYIQQYKENITITGVGVRGTTRRDVGGEDENAYYRDVVEVRIGNFVEVWQYYRHFGPGNDDGEETWIDITPELPPLPVPPLGGLTNRQKNIALRRLRFLIGRKGNRGRRRRQALRNNFNVPGTVQCHFSQDEYDGPQGQGVVIILRVVLTVDEIWVYSIHKGPEKYRDENSHKWIRADKG